MVGEKCPHCGIKPVILSLDPLDVELVRHLDQEE